MRSSRLFRMAAVALAALLAGSGWEARRAPAADPGAPPAPLAAQVLGPAAAEAQSVASGTAYVANEGTATVSVIDAATNTVKTTICLGSDPPVAGTPQPAGPCNGGADYLKPFYDGHVGTHGLWLAPDGSILLVTNRISGTVVAVDTATNTVLGYMPVGREPHLATVRPGGREAWVAVRGENYLQVLELEREDLWKQSLPATRRMESDGLLALGWNGPSMVSFTKDGRRAFVAYGKTPVVHKIDAEERRVVASKGLSAPFTPFGLVTPDDRELYLVHKGTGKLSVLRTSDLGFVVQDLPVGPRANHVAFVGNLAYVTVAGPAPSSTDSDPEGKVVVIDRTTAPPAIVREFTGPAWTGEPHGIWATPDGRRLYIGHERGNRVTVLDVGQNPHSPDDDTVVGTITDPLMKQPIDVVIKP
jgi:YVTN family beta-propeller protein